MVTESKGTTVVASLIHKGPTVSYRYTTLVDATSERVGIGIRWGEIAFSPLLNIAENLIDTYPIWPGVLMEFAHMQEDNRDYYRQRIQKN